MNSNPTKATSPNFVPGSPKNLRVHYIYWCSQVQDAGFHSQHPGIATAQLRCHATERPLQVNQIVLSRTYYF